MSTWGISTIGDPCLEERRKVAWDVDTSRGSTSLDIDGDRGGALFRSGTIQVVVELWWSDGFLYQGAAS
jgi:hypothetical protein